MFPNLPNGHLYQWITTCGTLLAVASIIGVAVQVNSANLTAYETASELLSKNASENAKRFWTQTFQTQQTNTHIVTGFLLGSAAFGVVVALLGGWFWYRRVQWYEDEERRLGHLNREHDVDEKLKRKKLILDSSGL